MNSSGATPKLASARQIAIATAAAVVVGVTIVFVAVLPFEYGIDPLRTGRSFGLLRGTPTGTTEVTPRSPDADMTPSPSGALARYGRSYRVDHLTLDLGPYQYVEYKYHLAEGAAMLYAWQATAPVLYDLHGARDGSPSGGNEPSVAKGTNRESFGSLTAPFPGMHGWYWENPGGTRITISLSTAGFYSSAIEYRSNRSTREHAIEPPMSIVEAKAKQP